MRLVMSKKQTRRPTQKVLKEGWIMHHTDKNDMRKRHYWRLDTKSIVMYHDETSSRYYKEIPLSDILSIRSLLAKPEHGPQMMSRPQTHWFELKTAAMIYCVGTWDESQLDVAAQWESAIRQAWMPVTPTSSTGSGAGQLRGMSFVVVYGSSVFGTLCL